MHVLFSAAVIACPLRTTYCLGSDSLILDTKTVHFKEDEGKLQSWTKLGILLNFGGVFQFTHTLPLPSPHKQRWTHVSRFFFPVSALYRVGEGKLQENFEKDALFHDSLQCKEDEGKLQSWTKLGILLNFWGVFQFTHTLPLPSPHKQHWTHVSRFFFFQFRLCIGWGEGKLQEISKRMHCFMIACVQTTSSPLRFLRRGGGGGVCIQAIL